MTRLRNGPGSRRAGAPIAIVLLVYRAASMRHDVGLGNVTSVIVVLFSIRQGEEGTRRVGDDASVVVGSVDCAVASVTGAFLPEAALLATLAFAFAVAERTRAGEVVPGAAPKALHLAA